MATIDNIKLILNLDTDTQDSLLELLISNCEQAIKVYTGLETVPEALGFITEELVVERFSLIGSESLTEENIAGHSVKFLRTKLEDYSLFLNAYIETPISDNSNRFYMR
jgi:hypothetical protein